MLLSEMPELLFLIVAFPLTVYFLITMLLEMPEFTIPFLLCNLAPILPISVIYRIKYKKRFAQTANQVERTNINAANALLIAQNLIRRGINLHNITNRIIK